MHYLETPLAIHSIQSFQTVYKFPCMCEVQSGPWMRLHAGNGGGGGVTVNGGYIMRAHLLADPLCCPVSMYRKTTLPLVSTIDHIESHYNFKPGKGIVNFCRDTPVVKDLFYCLLQGRPLVLLGRPSDEK